MRQNITQDSEFKTKAEPRSGEQGFMLLGLIVAIAIILMVLGVAASEAAFSLRRDREVESARRANQYVRAIRKFYLKNGNRYPGSIEQLEGTNRLRFLRQRYVDPLTGKADYRLIPVGQNKTIPKGFFGEPLGGIANQGLGAVAGLQSPGFGGSTATSGTAGAPPNVGASGIAGASGASAGTGIFGSTGASFGSTGTSATNSPTNPSSSNGPGGNSLGSASGLGSDTGTGLPGSKGPFMGVGSSALGSSILVVNEQTSFDTWEFLYDPRIEKLKAGAALNAGPGSVGAGSLGTAPGGFGAANGTSSSNPTGFGGSSAPTGTPPTKP